MQIEITFRSTPGAVQMSSLRLPVQAKSVDSNIKVILIAWSPEGTNVSCKSTDALSAVTWDSLGRGKQKCRKDNVRLLHRTDETWKIFTFIFGCPTARTLQNTVELTQ